MGPSANPMDNDSNIEEKSEAEFETDNEAQKQVHDTSMCARENSMHVQHDSPTRNTYGDAFDNEDGQIDMVDRVVLPNLSSNFVDWKIRVKELILLLLLTCLFRQLLLITPSWPYNLHLSKLNTILEMLRILKWTSRITQMTLWRGMRIILGH